ncbi:ABC transporter permease [uncultured Cohaesibacter sp.]|uniref:ABC transporter permease n=1 Tax=uncultured Cohaesibacter sp. TaxID=1002546 RepID=UPI0029C7338E|nr:ABC transporter permease [uncultured Cohaesibacter sp.]
MTDTTLSSSSGSRFNLKRFVIPLVLVGMLALFSVLSPYFFTAQNLTNILVQNSYVVVAAVGLSFVMISGGIDLSIGYQISVVGVVTAVFMKWVGLPVAPSVMIGIVSGVAMGVANGMASIFLRVHSLIVTLGTLTVYQGLSYIISNQSAIINLPRSFKFIGQGYLWQMIPVPVVVMVICVLIAAFILGFTPLGRMIYAIGGNEDAAYLTGIPVTKVKIFVYSICGLFAGISAILLFARSGSASSSTGPGTEFTAITAAVLGGISFKGGEGKMLGLVTGVLILGVLGNGMQLIGVNTYAQYIVKGLVLLAAVGFDTYQNTAKTKKKVA